MVSQGPIPPTNTSKKHCHCHLLLFPTPEWNCIRVIHNNCNSYTLLHELIISSQPLPLFSLLSFFLLYVFLMPLSFRVSESEKAYWDSWLFWGRRERLNFYCFKLFVIIKKESEFYIVLLLHNNPFSRKEIIHFSLPLLEARVVLSFLNICIFFWSQLNPEIMRGINQ